jgi:hypothetical protein
MVKTRYMSPRAKASRCPAQKALFHPSINHRINHMTKRLLIYFMLLMTSTMAALADVNVLVIGSATDSSSHTYVYDEGVAAVSAFDPADVVTELTSILGGAGLGTVNVSFEDFHGTSSGYRHANLFHWFHFPYPADAETTRWANLRGENGTVWDYVVLIGDAHTMEYLPGFYALGVSEIAKEVAKGSAETVLLMPWPAAGSSTTLDHYKEVVYRVGRTGGCAVAPAGLAWEASGELSGVTHPTDNGAYIAAATLYSRLFGQSASASTYSYNDTLANSAYATVQANQGAVQYSGEFATPNPYSPQHNTNRNVDFSITGTSTERGHIVALEDVMEANRMECTKHFSHRYNTDDPEAEQSGWPTNEEGSLVGPIDFNFGKFHFYTYDQYAVNTNFWKHTYIFEYQQTLTEDSAVGLILNHDIETGARAYMQSPFPGAIGATIPRASWAMLYRLKPDIEMNASGNHLTDLAILPNATFIATVDSGRCPLTPEEADPTDEWVAMKVGYEAGWIMSRLQARAPGFRVLPSAADKQEINNYEDTGSEEMTVQFIFEPEAEVTVNLTSSNPSLMTISPSTLTFTTNNYDVAQAYTVSIADGVDATEEEIEVIVTTTSDDEVYNDLSDSWAYTAKARAEASLPVAVEDSYRVGVNQVLTVAVDEGLIANDISNPLSPITQVTRKTAARFGSLNLSSDGSFTYTPNADFDGKDSFSYTATNANGDSQEVTVTLFVSDLEASLILKYDFEDLTGTTVKDSTAYGRDGTINSSITQVDGVADGKFGADLTSGSIDIPMDQEFYDLVDDEISIAFWGYINPVATNSANDRSYMLKGTKTYGDTTYKSLSIQFHTKMVDDEYLLYWENGIYTEGSTTSITGTPSMYKYKLETADTGFTPSDINGQWAHWTFMRNRVSGNSTIYKDGVLVGSWASDGLFAMGLIDEIDELLLGDGYNGNVDDFRIYNRELSAAEIATIMVEGAPPEPQTWTGTSAVDNLWSTPENWSLGTVPETGSTLEISNGEVIGISSDAVLPALSKISLLNGELVIAPGANLALQSGSVLTVDGGSITRDASFSGENINIGISGTSSLLEISSGSLNLTAGSSGAANIHTDLTISGGDIDNDTQTRLYGALTIQGSDATIDFLKFKGFAGSTITFELDETGVSPINVGDWATLADTQFFIDGSAYTGGAATITLLKAADRIVSVSTSDVIVTGLENRGYTVQVNQSLATDDVTLVIGVDSTQTWTGNAAADDLWTTPENWSLGTIPEADAAASINAPDVIDISAAAVIPSGSTVSLTAGTLAINALADLDLQSGSVLNVAGGSITRDDSWTTGNLNIGNSGVSSLIDMSSGSMQFTEGNATVTAFYSDLTISGGDIDTDTQTRIYGTLAIQGRAATIDFKRLQGFAGSTIHFELDEIGVSPINVPSWASLAAATLSIDGSSYTGGEATIPLINSTDLKTLALDENITVTGLPSPYIGWVEQDETTDDVTLVIVDNSDTDGDGHPDWEEVITGTDPADATSIMKMKMRRNGNNVAFSWPTASGRKYSVDRSTDLKTWAVHQENVEFTEGEDASIDMTTETSSADAGFYRIRVTY